MTSTVVHSVAPRRKTQLVGGDPALKDRAKITSTLRVESTLTLLRQPHRKIENRHR